MSWHRMRTGNSSEIDARLKRSTCLSCSTSSYWVDGELVSPRARLGEPASPDLPASLQATHAEARDIAARSPRSAAALLRTLVEQLAAELGYANGTLYERIQRMSDDGKVPATVVLGMDAVRSAGNQAVHEGTLPDVTDSDLETVLLLFGIVEDIVAAAITRPRQIEELTRRNR
jgi:hypothetical protein